jgi:DNA-binding response OmpR family regulator
MSRILVVDDDPHIRELLHHCLVCKGLEVVEASDGEQALVRLEEVQIDCAILDVMMPVMDGWELCRVLKEHFDFPVLMLTAKGETAQKVKGLDLGADDYLVKPFEEPELLARVRALLRRWKVNGAQKIQLGSLVLDRQARDVMVGKGKVTLPRKEFELLLTLGSSPGTTLSRDVLIERIWGYEFEGTARTVDVHINRLRERFPESQFGFRIATIRGMGYRLEILK